MAPGVSYRRAVTRRWIPWAVPTADRLVLALGALVVVLAGASSDDPGSVGEPRDLDWLAGGLLVLGAVVVLVGGRFPALVAAGALSLTFVWYSIGYTSGLINVVALGAFFRLGVSDGQERKLAVTAGATVVTIVNMTLGGEPLGDAFTAAGYILMAVLFGELIRSRHLLLEQYAARAARAKEEAERRVAEERLRIARDVHDLLAHTVSVMTVQAGVARDAIDRDTDAAKAALANIRQAGREAMGEMQATVSVLRSGGEAVTTAPSPRLDRVAELVDTTREHGVEVVLETDLSGRPLPELVELTGFRVVQESLTNVVRHAGATRARVSVCESASALTIEVRDDGAGSISAVSTAAGFGLRGMAERVESIGGELWHGRDGHSGWTVRATLPLARSG